MYFRKYFALGLAILFAFSVVVLVLRVATSSQKKTERFTGFCPVCKQALPYEGAKCAYCVFIDRMKVDGRKPAESSELTAVGKLAIASVILGLLTLLAYLPELRVVYRKWRTSKEETFVVRCTKCRRKLRYFASSAGKQGACPGCREMLTFPAIPGVTPVEPATNAV